MSILFKFHFIYDIIFGGSRLQRALCDVMVSIFISQPPAATCAFNISQCLCLIIPMYVSTHSPFLRIPPFPSIFLELF